MPCRSVYLAKSRASPGQRTHFAIFIPNAADENKDLSKDFKTGSPKGTVIHVVGEPVMMGYALEFKRNDERGLCRDMREMVFLGKVDSKDIYDPPFTTPCQEACPRQRLEREAAMVAPPPRGQNVRAPIDGVTTKRCQEWTMEYLSRLEERGLISPGAVAIAQSHRDSPTHGIFGQKATGHERNAQ
ncbi:hypothetical protein E4U43_003164 [Claviceps pusilla]|uniref:Uncharacterized protein n=1 Tax=Claviceps pusilla TaxID=123648 RepID=A0A9P7N796_9HYPO|nr:hypothetical protein E4U43_003164 [Claviceps pusilla]